MNGIRNVLDARRMRVPIAAAIVLVAAWLLLGGLTKGDRTGSGQNSTFSADQDLADFPASSMSRTARSTTPRPSAGIDDRDRRKQFGVHGKSSSGLQGMAADSPGTDHYSQRLSLHDVRDAGDGYSAKAVGLGTSEYDPTSETEGGDPADSDEPIDSVERNGHISGYVLDQFGMAVAGVGLVATVRNLPPHPDSVTIPAEYMQYRTVSDIDGRYHFSQIIDGDYSVSTVSNGKFANAQITVRSGTNLANIVVSLERNVVVRGRVSNDKGQPLWGALVVPLVPGVPGTYTNGSGQYQLSAAFADTRRGVGIRARLEGYREQMLLLNASDLDSGSITADFVLEPNAMVAMVGGRIISADSGAPLPGVAIQMRSGELKRAYRTVTSDTGEFVLGGVETGSDYQLLVSGGESYQDFVQDRIEVSVSGLSLDIALDRSSQNSLYAQLSNLGGQAIPGYTLNMRRASPPFNTMQVTSDGSGRVAIHGVPAGLVIFEKQAYPQISISGVDVSDNVDEHVQLVLDWGTDELNGVVVDGSGHPVGGSTVLLTWSHSNNGIQSWSTRKTIADAQGNFGFRELGPGIHTLVVEAQGFSGTRLAHDVTADGYEVIVELDPISIDTGSGS